MKNKPFIVMVIGYIIGILWGLYFKNSIVSFYILFFIIDYIVLLFRKISRNENIKKKGNIRFKQISFRRYFRYIKLFLNQKVIISICIISIISNTIILSKENRYENLYKDKEQVNVEGIVVEKERSKNLYEIYKLKVIKKDNVKNNSNKFKNTYLYLNVKKSNSNNLECGDVIRCTGDFFEPETRRNYKGFDYKNYLKTKNIYGTIKIKNMKIMKKVKKFSYIRIKSKIKSLLETKIEMLFSKETANIYKGIILGETRGD